MKRKATMVFAVAIAGRTAMADPAPSVRPRTLATGQPACGNVMLKGVEPPACTTLRVIVTTVLQEGEQIRAHLPRDDRRLTLAMGTRPRP